MRLAGDHHLEASILVVDDESSNIQLLSRMLERGGYTRVRSTTDPRIALALAAYEPPDVLLLDLHMPGMEGLDLLRLLRDQSADLPFVLVLTGDTTREIKAAALAGGARDFLAKPFDVEEAMLRINNLADLRLSQRALSLYNRTLEKHVRERTRELEEARLDVLERLGLAAEFRDDDTGHHTRRVGLRAAALATQIGLPTDQVELIARGAPLHNVGKIAVPDSILLKAGPLSEAEQQVMKTHTVVGGRLLSGGQSELIRIAREIALTHHERWDGAGYPYGLSGSNIPLAGRIVAIADVYDALSHRRPYRPRFTEEAVRAHLLAERGRQFDEHILDVFIANYPAESASPDPVTCLT